MNRGVLARYLAMASLPLLAVVTGCSQMATVESDIDEGGLFAYKWEKIGRNETQVSYLNGENDVSYRRAMTHRSGNLYIEALALKNGSVFYWRYREENKRPIDLGELLQSRVGSTDQLREKDYRLVAGSIRNEKLDNGDPIAYGVIESSDQANPPCLLFARDHKEPVDKSPYELIFGVLCEPQGANLRDELASMTDRWLAKMRNVTFDRGAHARNHLFARALAQLRRMDANREKVPPSIDIQGAWLSGDELVVRGSVVDDSGVDVIWLAGRLIEPKPSGELFVRLAGVDAKKAKKHLALTAVDVNGNAKRIINFPLSADQPPTGGTRYDADDAAGSGKNYALIVAVDEYKNKEFKLTTPPNDARLIGELLETKYHFYPEVLYSPTAAQFRAAMEEKSKQLNPDDRLLVYFAGHGFRYPEDAPANEQSTYWLMSDFSLDKPDEWVSDQEIRKIVGRIPSRMTMLVSDSCFSGRLASSSSNAAFDEVADELTVVRTVMTSGSDQPVSDGKINSPFAEALADNLRERPPNSALSGNSLYKDVERLMTLKGYTVTQQPMYGVLMNEMHDPGTDFVLQPE